jgi:hypothetical protein
LEFVDHGTCYVAGNHSRGSASGPLSFGLRAVISTESHPSFGLGHRVVERLRFRGSFVCWEDSAPHLYPVLIQFQVKPEV